MKISTSILALAGLFGLVSCYPVNSNSPNRRRPAPTPAEVAAKKKEDAKKKAADEAKKARARARARAREKARNTSTTDNSNDNSGSDSSGSSNATGGTTTPPTPPVVKPKVIKYAAMVPGKEGFVFNPYTQNQVDVKGIPSGTKVRDPHDPNPAHIFRVP